VKLESKIVLKDKYLEFKPLLLKLKFTKGAKGWSAYFRSGMAQIPEEDYKTLEAELRKLT
jgi:predicted RNA-binding protein